jgi:hypothetical protein
VYALWYNGQFGEDNLYLLRPFSPQPDARGDGSLSLHAEQHPLPGERPAVDPSLSDGDKADLLRRWK